MKNINYFFLTIISILNISFIDAETPYGNNSSAGQYILLNNTKHYFEVYGSGKPLLLIHGNKTPISGFAPQIEFFSKQYKVFAIDCRGRGKSELGKDSLSYFQIAKDLSEFINKMKLDSVFIIGKSDGAIVGLLMGIYFPEHIYKMAAFGANLSPDTNAFYPSGIKEIHELRLKADSMLALNDTTINWKVEQQRYRMMEFQPHITETQLHKIDFPVLVISCDRDVIKEEHTLQIYKSIPKANLCIFPGEKHGVPRLNPQLFNSTIDTFFSRPFKGDEMRFED